MSATDKLPSRIQEGGSVRRLGPTRIFGLRNEIECLGECVSILGTKTDLENPVQLDRLASFGVNDSVGIPLDLLNAVSLSHGHLPCGRMLAAVAARNLTFTHTIGARHGFR